MSTISDEPSEATNEFIASQQVTNMKQTGDTANGHLQDQLGQ